MATAKQTKHSKNPATVINNKGKRELSPIGKELLNHCKNQQPVLLNGKDTIGREDLIRDVHLAIDDNNIDAGREYVDDSGKPVTREKLQDKFEEIYESKGLKELDTIKQEMFLLDHFKSTARTWSYVDCGAMTAKEIYIEMVIDAGIIGKAEAGDEESKILLDKYMSMDIGRISKDELRSLQGNDSLIDITAFSDAKELQDMLKDMLSGKIPEVEPVYKGYLFQCKGNLFIDNLPKPTSREDEKHYRRLAKIIKDRALGGRPTAFNWVAVYTHDDPNDPKDFDKYFLEPFKPIPLDRKEVVVEPATETYKDEQGVSYPVTVEVDRGLMILKCQGKTSKKLQDKAFQLLEFLWEKKDRLVTRNEIRKELWGENEKGKDEQITIKIGLLRNAFEKIGFEEKTVEEQIIITRTDTNFGAGGGYRFLSKLVSLEFKEEELSS